MGFQVGGINELVVCFEKLSQTANETIVVRIFTTFLDSLEWDELKANGLVIFRVLEVQ
jgi:hypothetical protein